MEKDIEILEDFIKEVVPEYEKVRIGCEEYEIPILPIKFKPTKEIAQAIENLINRVKELEEIEEEHRKENGKLQEKIKELEVENIHWRGRYHLVSRKIGVIPEDKIKEKIEELEKEADYRSIDNPTGRIHFHKEPCDYQLQVLQELLEE